MVSVNVRELTHHFSKYLKEVRSGERIIIMLRNVAVAEIIAHNANVSKPGWNRKINKLKLKGEAFSETVTKNRQGEKH